jgi:hypothetical protein
VETREMVFQIGFLRIPTKERRAIVKERDPLSELPQGVTTAGDALRKAFEGFSWFPNELIPVLFAPTDEDAIRTTLDTLMLGHQEGQLDGKEIQVSVTFFGTITQESQNEATRRHFVSWVNENSWRGVNQDRAKFAALYIPLKRLAASLQNHTELFESP